MTCRWKRTDNLKRSVWPPYLCGTPVWPPHLTTLSCGSDRTPSPAPWRQCTPSVGMLLDLLLAWVGYEYAPGTRRQMPGPFTGCYYASRRLQLLFRSDRRWPPRGGSSTVRSRASFIIYGASNSAGSRSAECTAVHAHLRAPVHRDDDVFALAVAVQHRRRLLLGSATYTKAGSLAIESPPRRSRQSGSWHKERLAPVRRVTV